jgi:hypothetical protein
VNDRDVPHEFQGSSAVVVITNYPGGKNVVLEDKCLGLPRVPLRPGHLRPTGLTIGIEFVGKPYDVVHEF